MVILEALKLLYKKLGGTADTEDITASSDMIDLIEDVAGGGGGSSLPSVTSDDNGDLLTVVDGAWAKAKPTASMQIIDLDTANQVMNGDSVATEIFVESGGGAIDILSNDQEISCTAVISDDIAIAPLMSTFTAGDIAIFDIAYDAHTASYGLLESNPSGTAICLTNNVDVKIFEFTNSIIFVFPTSATFGKYSNIA